MALKRQHHSLYRNDELGIQWEQISNRTPCGTGITKSKSYFFIDNDEREFLDLEACVDAYNDKFQFEGENPDHEVKYVKVIMKRDKAA